MENKLLDNLSININDEIESSLQKLESLLDTKGSVLSSHTGHYKSVSIRDNLFVSYAFETCGKMDRVYKIIENLFSIFFNYKSLFEKIIAMNDPLDAEKLMPGRFSADEHEELSQESYHLHFDFPALFLFRVAQLHLQNEDIINSKEKKELLQLIVNYLEVLDWTSSLEYGIWEEGPEIHTSTLACVIAALEILPKAYPEIKINKKLLNSGKRKFYKILPVESFTRKSDLAMLASFWPLAVSKLEDIKKILNVIEKSLVKRKGMIRYSGDSYYNTRPDSPRGTEPRWPLGLAWISIIYFSLEPLLENNNPEETETPEELTAQESIKKAFEYLEKTASLKTVNGGLPELISSGDANIHSPFAITEAMFLSACCLAKEYLNKEKSEN